MKLYFIYRTLIFLIIVILSFPDANGNVQESVQKKALNISLFGWNTVGKQRLLRNLLRYSVSSDQSYRDEFISKGIVLKSTKYNERDISLTFHENVEGSNVAFIYLDDQNFLNEQYTLSEFVSCFNSLNLRDSNASQSAIIVSFAGSESLLPKIQNLMKEAWTHYNANMNPLGFVGDLFSNVKVRFILSPPFLEDGQTLNPQATEAVITIIEDVASEASSNSLNTSSKATLPVQNKIGKGEMKLPEDVQFMENFQEVVSTSLQYIVQVANDEKDKYLRELNRLQENAKQFSKLLEELIEKALQRLDAETEKRIQLPFHKLPKNIQMALQKELLLRMYKSFAPLFYRQVQLIKQSFIDDFNDLVSLDNLSISIHIDDDLLAIQRELAKQFRRHVESLFPRHRKTKNLLNASMFWQSSGDQAELEKLLAEYAEKQIARYRVLGVLSRQVRKPIAVAMHAFLTHPLGLRDYRQDVLTADNQADELQYDPQYFVSPLLPAKERDLLVSPSAVRKILQEKIHKMKSEKSSFSFSRLLQLHDLQSQSEHARHMLMFPLFMKDPEISIASKSNRRRKQIIPKLDPLRESHGPERFIRWDIEPLNEVKSNLNIVEEQTKNQPVSGWDRWLNSIPKIAKGFYKHPVVNYGKKYT